VKIVALIPAFNEQQRIEATVRAVAAIETVDLVVVVDDASSDGTAEIAESAGAEVLRLPKNLGKGAALDAGLASAKDADVIVLLDGDLGETAAEAGVLLAPVLEDSADMTIAGFPPADKPGGFGLVKGLARWGIARLGGEFDATAPLSGQRALNAKAIAACTPFAFGYGVEVALTIRALRAGLRVREIPTKMRHAATGRDVAGLVHRGRQFLHVGVALLRIAAEGDSR